MAVTTSFITERRTSLPDRNGQNRTRLFYGSRLQTPEVLNGAADLVYTGKGALCWIMDITAWAEVVARLLVPWGRPFIHEGHPLNWVWDTDASSYVLDPHDGNYFSDQFKEGLPIRGSESSARYRKWSLGQIVNSVIGAGLKLAQLHEYPDPLWDHFPNMPAEILHRLPHAFALLAKLVR